MFSAATHRLITIPLAKYLDARLFGGFLSGFLKLNTC